MNKTAKTIQKSGANAGLPVTRTASARTVLSPDNLGLVEAVARTGSMAAAARELGLVPSAVTYRVRQVEEALDVLLFDRSARQARITPAGAELLRSGEHLLHELDAVAQRVKRVATGWEPRLTIAADNLIARRTLFELCEAFYALGTPTQLRLREETMTGTVEALLSGKADLALGVSTDGSSYAGFQALPLGDVPFVFAVAPQHPLAGQPEPLADAHIGQFRAVAVADTTQRGQGMSIGLLSGQDVLTVPTMEHKLEAQLMGLGCGFLPLPLAQPLAMAGQLVIKRTQRGERVARVGYAWRAPRGLETSPDGAAGQGKALQWWLAQLASPRTRLALLNSARPPA
jgi:molybdate transport repressor ModE-like protein